MADPQLPPIPQQVPQQGSWLLPALAGLGSFAAGFGVGRAPGGDPSIFTQPIQTMSLLDYRRGLTQHYLDQQSRYQQQAWNEAAGVAKQAAEYGNVEAIDGMKDRLGPFYAPLKQQAAYMRQVAGSQGFKLPSEGGQQPEGLAAVPQATPTQAFVQPPGAPPSAEGETSPYRPQQSRTMSFGKFSRTEGTPATTEHAMITDFLGRTTQKYGTLPLQPILMRDLQRENILRQRQGVPEIPWTKDAQEMYESQLRFYRPDLWTRLQTMEAATKVPPEVATRQLAGTQDPLAAFREQATVEQQRSGAKTEQEAAGRLRAEPAPEGVRSPIALKDRLFKIAVAIQDLQPEIEKRYGAYPGPVTGLVNWAEKMTGQRDPLLQTYMSLLGELMAEKTHEFAGSALTPQEVRRISTFIPDPNTNVRESFGMIGTLGLTLGDDLRRQLPALLKTYGGEQPGRYSFMEIEQRRKSGQRPVYPELSGQSRVSPLTPQQGGAAQYRLVPDPYAPGGYRRERKP